MRLEARIARAIVQRDGSAYRASVNVSFRVVREGSALDDHGRGYAIIAERVARSFSNSHISARGSSAAQAQSRLAQAERSLASDAQRELHREAQVYDAVTESGRAQDQGPQYGFPGGRDSTVVCSPPR